MFQGKKESALSAFLPQEQSEISEHFKQALSRVEEPWFSKRMRHFRNTQKSYLLAKYAGFDVKSLHDPAVTLYLNALTLAAAVPLFRRFRLGLTGLLCYGCLAFGRFYWGGKLAVERGVLRHALFGQDDLAHELRVLLAFHNPDSLYQPAYLHALSLRNASPALKA